MRKTGLRVDSGFLFFLCISWGALGHWKREIESWTDFHLVVYYDPFKGRDSRKVIRDFEFYNKTATGANSDQVIEHLAPQISTFLHLTSPSFMHSSSTNYFISMPHRFPSFDEDHLRAIYERSFSCPAYHFFSIHEYHIRSFLAPMSNRFPSIHEYHSLLLFFLFLSRLLVALPRVADHVRGVCGRRGRVGATAVARPRDRRGAPPQESRRSHSRGMTAVL